MAAIPRERRLTKRYLLQIPIHIIHFDGRPELTGVTQDVSMTGVLFTVPGWRAGTRTFDCTLMFPAAVTSVGQPVEWRCSGTVVRLQTSAMDQTVAVAARLQLNRATMKLLGASETATMAVLRRTSNHLQRALPALRRLWSVVGNAVLPRA